MRFLLLWTALIVGSAARVLEKRSQNIPIGFRAVDETLAKKYMDWGNQIIWEGGPDSYQLGQGIYLTADFATYPLSKKPTTYDCAVLTDQDAWNSVNKVVVPPTTYDQCPKRLWWGDQQDGQGNDDGQDGGSNRAGYVQAESGGDISTTVLISDIEFTQFQKANPNGVTQFLIPPKLLTSGTLTLYVQCAQKNTDAHAALGAAYGPYGYDPVDWQEWQNLHFAMAPEQR